MINWKEIAEQHGLTPEQFRREVYAVAAVIGIMEVEKGGNADTMRFTCSDDIGQIELTVTRKN